MTVEDIRRMTDDFIKPATAGSVMKMNPGRLIQYARDGQLPFPVQMSGNRIKISRIGFLNWIDGKKDEPKRTPMEEMMEQLIGEIHQQNVLLYEQNILLSSIQAGR